MAKVSASDLSTAPALTLTSALFVGGRSLRMGSDKALLPCSTGEPLWPRQLNLLRALQPSYIWISARMAPPWSPAGVEVILDSTPSRGPLSGICACLARLETTHLMVLAIDMPRMTFAHLRKLADLAEADRSLIPTNGDYFEPLCAIYSKSSESVASAFLAGTDNSLQKFAQRLVQQRLAAPYPISAVEKSLYLNVNRPEDLSAI